MDTKLLNNLSRERSNLKDKANFKHEKIVDKPKQGLRIVSQPDEKISADVIEFKAKLEKIESKKIIEKELRTKTKINNTIAAAFSRAIGAGFSKAG